MRFGEFYGRTFESLKDSIAGSVVSFVIDEMVMDLEHKNQMVTDLEQVLDFPLQKKLHRRECGLVLDRNHAPHPRLIYFTSSKICFVVRWSPTPHPLPTRLPRYNIFYVWVK